MPPWSRRVRNGPKEVRGASEASAVASPTTAGEPPFAQIFEVMPQALALWRPLSDGEGHVDDLELIAANKVFRNAFHVPEAGSRRLSELEPSYREHELDPLGTSARVLASGQTESMELHDPRRDRWFEFKAAAFPGNLVLTSAEDITESRATRSDLLRARYSLDRMGDFPTWTDSSGRIIEVSESACRQLEYTREELLNMTVFDVSPHLDPAAWERSWKDLKPGQFFRAEVNHRTKSGRIFPTEITVHSMVFDGQECHCTFSRDISDRKKAEAAVERLRYSVDHMDDYPTWNDREGRIIEVSESTCRHLEYTREELLGMTIFDINPNLDMLHWKHSWESPGPKSPFLVETYHRTKSGRVFPIEITVSPMTFDGVEYHCTFCRDISDRKYAERTLKESEERFRQLWEAQNETLDALRDRDEQLLQAQKMEAIGRLAGGIAHDFNNVLTTIIGYSDLILSSPDCPEGSTAEDVAEIREAAHRAASLTQQILAFSRRQAMEPRRLSLNDVVSDIERLLTRTIGADIELRTSLDSALGKVEVDEHQFVQVLLNLAVNARDAMPEGGTLIIATTNVDLDDAFCATHPEARPGPHVKVAVTDTGSGMDSEVLARVFEPFYTTKPPGLGTGLGLATAYGIIAQSGGCIYVDSESGQGTTFSVYLPRADPVPIETEGGSEPATDTKSAGTLMVVDSDQPFLTLTTRILQRRGFKVLPFGSGERAARALADPHLQIDALITDIALSGDMQGRQVAESAIRLRPGLPLLFTDGESTEGRQDAEVQGHSVTFLEKPFTADELILWVETWLTKPDSMMGDIE